MITITRLTGLLFDPTYTGKAIYELRKVIAAGRFDDDDHIVFWHTGGEFGTLVDSELERQAKKKPTPKVSLLCEPLYTLL